MHTQIPAHDPTVITHKKRIVILGAGFGGLYAAMRLEKLLSWHDDYEIILINRENYFVYQPMLAEIISGNVGVFDTVSPLRQLLRKTSVLVRDIEHIDLENKVITASPGIVPVPHLIDYDYLVLALGNVTDFRGMTGLTQHALPFKTMEDALRLRHRVIHALEEASIEEDPFVKQALLTFVVAGGGWSGVECVAEINSLVRGTLHTYRNIKPNDVRIILLHSGETILEQLVPSLRDLARQVLEHSGVDIRFKTLLTAATGTEAIVKTKDTEEIKGIPTRTLVSTVPSSPNPIIEKLNLPKDKRHRVFTDSSLQVKDSDHIWAIGDCAAIPDPNDPTGATHCPPTAQHAVRQGDVCAYNIVATIRKARKKTFGFKGLGNMGALGHHSAVAQIFGFKLHGVVAWLMWRAVYLMKMPGWDRQVRTACAWLMAQVLPQDIVELRLEETRGVVEEHYEPGQVVFNQGDIGDRLYIIKKGTCDVIRMDDGAARKIVTLKDGQFFGEMALLNQTTRTATIRAVDPLDVLSVPKKDLSALIEYLPALRESFQHIVTVRQQENESQSSPSTSTSNPLPAIPPSNQAAIAEAPPQQAAIAQAVSPIVASAPMDGQSVRVEERDGQGNPTVVRDGQGTSTVARDGQGTLAEAVNAPAVPMPPKNGQTGHAEAYSLGATNGQGSHADETIVSVGNGQPAPLTAAHAPTEILMEGSAFACDIALPENPNAT